jgi:hypothetical protein
MSESVRQSVSPIKEHMLRFLEKHPNQQMYRFAAGPGVDAQDAIQAGVEVASEQHVPIIVYVQEDEEPTAQEGTDTWTRAQ